METTSKPPALRAAVALPPVAVALSVLYVVVAQTAARLTAPGAVGTTLDVALVTVAGTLVVVFPVLWVGARTLDGLSGTAGHLGANGYAALLCVVVFWARIVPVGRGGKTIESPLPGPDTAVTVLLTVGLLVGVAASLWRAWTDETDEEDRSATRTADRPRPSGGGSVGRSTADADEESPPARPGRRTLLGVSGGVVVALVGGVAVGRDLAVDYGCCVPLVQFDYVYEGDTVTVTHAGGDTVDADNTGRLQVLVEEAVAATWPLPVSAGDEVSVSVAPGEVVEVVWYAPTGEQRQVLSDFTVPG